MCRSSPRSRGVPLVAVGVAARGFYGKLVASNPNANLKTLADFKGKHIGTQMGTGMFTIVLMLLEKQGLKESDFNFTNLRVVDMPGAMATSSNNLDAVIGWEPGMRRIVNAGHGKVVIPAKKFEEMANITYPFLLTTTQSYRKDHPDVVQKVVNAYEMADKFIGTHKEETVKIYVDEVARRGGKLTRRRRARHAVRRRPLWRRGLQPRRHEGHPRHARIPAQGQADQGAGRSQGHHRPELRHQGGRREVSGPAALNRTAMA